MWFPLVRSTHLANKCLTLLALPQTPKQPQQQQRKPFATVLAIRSQLLSPSGHRFRCIVVAVVVFIVVVAAVSRSPCDSLFILVRASIAASTILMNDIRMKALYHHHYHHHYHHDHQLQQRNNNCNCSSNDSNSNNSNSNHNSSNSKVTISNSVAVQCNSKHFLSNNNSNKNNNSETCLLPPSSKCSTSNTNKNSTNNHRTYNDSSKSDKVFLLYTARDPRLRISNKPIIINKHFVHTSELRITEDLCHYGELIGGATDPSEFKCDLTSEAKQKTCAFVIDTVTEEIFQRIAILRTLLESCSDLIRLTKVGIIV